MRGRARVADPIEVSGQITFLLFIERLDDLQTLEENKAQTLGQPIERRIFPEGTDELGRANADDVEISPDVVREGAITEGTNYVGLEHLDRAFRREL